MVALLDNTRDLSVYFDRRALGIVGFLGKISAQENLFFFFAECHRSKLFAHAPLADHPARKIRSFLDIVPRAGGYALEHKLLGHAAAKQDDQIIEEILPRVSIL